jgi:hypothetical protein
MLQKLSDHISACLQRAEECKEAAVSETDERMKSQLLDMERQWRHVAKSYEFIESLERFLLDQQQHALPEAAEEAATEQSRCITPNSSQACTLAVQSL